LFWRRESFGRKLRALAHTCLGACLAAYLAGRGVRHIHVHHGYFSAWVAMVAARLLGISFSMTLHGSDLLQEAPYLDVKLAGCQFCVTISEFNRRHLLRQYPQVPDAKVLVQRLGVALPVGEQLPSGKHDRPLVMLAVGRLHAVKDHAFLIRACRLLRDRGLPVLCLIAGEGPERSSLERLIAGLNLHSAVSLLGHVPRHQLEAHYRSSDLVVLTSRSEGLPLVLMEAMSHSRPVLAPAITGIPELVVHGWSGFLYRQGSLADFVGQVERIANSRSELGPVCERARRGVLQRFDRERNLAAFADTMLNRISQSERDRDEDLVLQ
jgi:colanic acid/amylovoran biosynthesis glycosyltransferase